MKRWLWRVLAAGVLTCSLAATGADIGQAAPEFALPTLKQEDVQLTAFKGKVVYLDFWASWCGPCRKTFPWMNQINAKYAQEGLQILAVSVDQDRAAAEKFLAQYPPEFQILLDQTRKIAKLYGVKGVPTSFLIDRDGVLRHSHLGMNEAHFAEVEAELQGLLKAGR